MIALVLPLALTLAGLWGADLRFPQVAGPLTVDARAPQWIASIDGSDVAVQHSGRSVSFAMPAGRGRFHGTIDNNGTLRGMWTQPATVMNAERFASPVTLRSSPSHVWRGVVRPLVDRITWYIDVVRRPDGSEAAFIRDPGANAGIGRRFNVQVDGSAIVFHDRDDPHDELHATLDAAATRFDLTVPDIGPMRFTRRRFIDALGFAPRTMLGDRWTYHAPLALDDGWGVGTLGSTDFASAPISSLVRSILATKTTSARTPAIQALLVARHGRLVLEEYFNGFDADRPHDMRSAGKTFTGLLTGIALDHGASFTLQSSVVSLLGGTTPYAHEDARKRRITVADLLSMRSGLACDDNDDRSPGNEDRMQAQTWQPDYYRFALDLPMARAPGGTAAVYCTAGINVLGGIVRHTLHMTVTDAFDRFIARPLQFDRYALNLSPNGDAYAGGGLYLRARDALKLGQLALNGGSWRGRRVVSKSWIDTSTTSHATFAGSRFSAAHGYGYTWHLFRPRVGGRTYREYMAQGNGGQLIIVLPELDMTVLILAANYGNFPTWRAFYDTLVPRYLITAALKPGERALSRQPPKVH